MKRSVWFLSCAILGLALFVCGLLVPAHLRAVNISILQRAGKNTRSLIQDAQELVNEKRLGAAQLLVSVAKEQGLSGAETVSAAVDDLARQHPGWVAWGGPEPSFESIFQHDSRLHEDGSESFTEYVIRLENRERVIQLLQSSASPIVQGLLRTRALTNTTVFPPSQSASGQAFDAAIAVCGSLADRGHLADGLSNAVVNLAAQALAGGSTQPFEEVLVNLMSLGERFNWGRLAVFVERIPDAETLRRLANLVRRVQPPLPVLFSAVHLSGEPKAVADYLVNFRQTGPKDLELALRFGAGGVRELLHRNQRISFPAHSNPLLGLAPFGLLYPILVDYDWRSPELALALKWLLYLLAGYFLAAAVHFALPAATVLEQPLQVRGFHVAREVLFAFGFLFAVLLLSEPFLSQESQKMDFPIRLRLPVMGNLLPAAKTQGHISFMNHLNMLTLLLFFVLQGLLYTACLVKLAEIRRQRVPARIKLKLLENEDHLFDAGLYLGFVGTIISLILVSLGVGKFSLMAAYSSTSFGIIFVSIFKIFHLRPTRRKLLLEAEAGPAPEPVAAAVRPSFATHS
jgi:hypothetical protein